MTDYISNIQVNNNNLSIKAEELKGTNVTARKFLYDTVGGNLDISSDRANIESIKGNTIKFAQVIKNGDFTDGGNYWQTTGGTISVSNNILTWSTSNPDSTNVIWQDCIGISNHTYYTRVCLKAPNNFYLGVNASLGDFIGTGNSFAVITKKGAISSSNNDLGLYIMPMTNTSIEIKSWICIDLTALGLETATDSIIEEWLATNIGLRDYYPYTEGSLVPVKMTGIKTVGFNQWDEEWESGSINFQDGTETINPSMCRSKNYIKVFPNTTYYAKAPNRISQSDLVVIEYDTSKNFIKHFPGGSGNTTLNTSGNAGYIRFTWSSKNVYNNDICINLVHSGRRNGEYEPYWSETKQINVCNLQGKLNGEGSLVRPFIDGMNAVNGISDEIIVEGDEVKAIKRLGVIDLGNETWSKPTSAPLFVTSLSGSKYNTNNLLCALYDTINEPHDYTSQVQGTGYIGISGNQLFAEDSAYDNTTDFKTAMSGVKLVYELATPEIYILQNYEFPINYKVDDFGTEEILVPVSQTIKPTSCAPTLGIRYNVNAVDTIRRQPQSYISKESMLQLLSTLGTVLNGTIKMTFDSPTNRYKYQFIANPVTDNLFKFLGNVSAAISDNAFEGPWTIDGKTYDIGYIKFRDNNGNFVRSEVLDTIISGTKYYAWSLQNPESTSGSIKIIYTTVREPTTSATVYYDNGGTMTILSNYTIDETHSPAESYGIELKRGMIAIYENNNTGAHEEYIFGNTGWKKF